MKLSFTALLCGLFSVILLGIVAIGFMAHQNSLAFISIASQLEVSNQILEETDIILDADDADENDIHGYIFTRDSAFVRKLESSRSTITAHLDKLQAMTLDNPKQQENIRFLRQEIIQKNAFFDTLIKLRNLEGTQNVGLYISGTDGQKRIGGVNQAVSVIEMDETNLLKEQQKASAESILGLNHIFLVITIPVFFIMIVLVIVLRTFSRRKRKQEETQRLNTILEERVTERTEELQELNKSLDQKVRERTAQLEEANKDLESFSYTVSHDLRAPLRVITGYGKILVRDADKLSGNSQLALEAIIHYAKHAGQLIDDLLNFSRLGKASLTKIQVDMDDMVQEVLTGVKMVDGRDNAEIQIKDLKPAPCDRILVKQVWVNLISNALKYSSKKEKPVIQIGSMQHKGQLTYYVKDNGAGFDMKYADKLFGVFQRLHAPSEFEGTGVGLSLAHKIISKHGGQMWAESKVEEGATFYFTLPAAA